MQPGDTISGLAQRLNTTEQAIWLLNGLDNLDELAPGDVLCVPPYPLSCAEGTLYTVKEGETLLSIARREGIGVLNLIDMNPYVEPGDLAAGQIICLPGREDDIPPYTPEYLTDTVQYGQTLSDVLIEYDISYEAFRLANPSLNPDRLLPGQRYLIPPSGMRGLCPHHSYVILDGEGLESIALQFGMPEINLLKANPSLAPGDFTIGQTICLEREF